MGKIVGWLAEAEIRRGRVSEARALAERALGLYEPGQDPPEDVARASFVLARALEGEPAEAARARTLAEQALEGFSGKDRTAVEEWLRQHPPPGDAPVSAEGP